MSLDLEDFEKVRTEGEVLYKNIGEVHCPYFKEKILFNLLGLEHLKFKRREKARSEEDQYMRFKLLHIAPEIVKLSYTLQGLQEVNKFERIRKHSRTELVLKHVRYYEFIALIKRDRVKVIIKQIENGEKFFWSIIPFWGMREETRTRILHEGNLEED